MQSTSKQYSNYEFIDQQIIDKYANDKYTYDVSYINDYIEILEGNCPNRIYVCSFARGEYLTAYGFIIDASLYSELPKTGTISVRVNGESWNTVLNNCQIGAFNKKESNTDSIRVDIPCKFYGDLLYGESGLSELFCKIGEDGCTVDRINQYNSQKENVTQYCRSLIDFASYIDPCLDACRGLKQDLALIESASLIGECGFSKRVIVWANNILKWIKYILPVLVIIFGIIDFIKTMISNNDDEIKKSQKRFIKRLITVALVFIIPLIITFILNKTGFTAEACGIDVLK